MNWVSSFNCLRKNTEERNRIQGITDKLPDNKTCAQEILDILGNSKSRIILDGGLKNSYYVFLNDTIYISNRERNKKIYSRVCLVAHECAHSMQSKFLQKINFMLSNLELLLFFILLVVSIINKDLPMHNYIYYGIVVASIVPRLYLELDAVIKSVPLATKYMHTKLDQDEVSEVEKVYNIQTKVLLPLFIIQLFLNKIIRVAIIMLV